MPELRSLDISAPFKSIIREKMVAALLPPLSPLCGGRQERDSGAVAVVTDVDAAATESTAINHLPIPIPFICLRFHLLRSAYLFKRGCVKLALAVSGSQEVE